MYSLSARPETRPDYNTGTGFFVKAGKLYEANGVELFRTDLACFNVYVVISKDYDCYYSSTCKMVVVNNV